MSSADESGRGDDHEARLSELDAQGHDRGAGNRHRRTGGGKRGCSQITAAHGPDGKASCRSSPGPGRCGMSGGGGVGLDVGCGSGALTIACAKRNPQGRMVGIDRWGVEYASYSRKLCERNAQAEGVDNAAFQKGDARHLDFPDETFDAVTSNYVYHNVMGADKRVLLLETLRVLKKGGVFALNDDMKPRMYGDMEEFARELRDMGYEDVRLIDTAAEAFGSRRWAAMMMLDNSRMLVGRK